MQREEIYQKIGELLWSIMPIEAVRIDFIGSIYPEHYSGGSSWVSEDGQIHYNDPNEIEYEIILLMKELKKSTSQEWTQYTFSLYSDMKFDIKFAYIPEEDSWGSLYMRGISDLTWGEADEHNISKEIWEERVKVKERMQKH